MTEHHNTLLIDGRGQAKEGLGHDAFAGVDYDLINRIRIVDVTIQNDQIAITGDATAAYEPEHGLKKFVRRFEYSPSNGFTIRDDVETSKPAVITSLIHADSGLKKEAHQRFVIERGSVRLGVDVIEPKEIQSSIEVNSVTAAGPPGAVDKGERQERGQKLLLSTAQPSKKVTFVIRLKISNMNRTQTLGEWDLRTRRWSRLLREL